MESEFKSNTSPSNFSPSPARMKTKGMQAVTISKLENIQEDYILALTDCNELSEVNVIAIRNKGLK